MFHLSAGYLRWQRRQAGALPKSLTHSGAISGIHFGEETILQFSGFLFGDPIFGQLLGGTMEIGED